MVKEIVAKGTKPQGKQLRLTGPVIKVQREPEKPKKKVKEAESLGISELSQRMEKAMRNELAENGSDGRISLAHVWNKVTGRSNKEKK